MSYLALLRAAQQPTQWTHPSTSSRASVCEGAREQESLYEPPWIKSRRNKLLDEAQADSDYWRSSVAQINGYVFPNGLVRIPARELYFQLGVPPSYRLTASKRVVPLMRSLGWTKRRIGQRGARQWVWEKFDIAAIPNPPLNLAARDQGPPVSKPACPANPFIPCGRRP